jgi:hypothetical protein
MTALLVQTPLSLDGPDRIVLAGRYGVESRLQRAMCGDGLPEEETRERFSQSIAN